MLDLEKVRRMQECYQLILRDGNPYYRVQSPVGSMSKTLVFQSIMRN